MTNGKIKLFFLGSGLIAVPSLVALHEDPSIDLLGVGTQPDKKAGRGNKMTATAVGQEADKLGLKLWKFANVNEEENLEYLYDLAPDLIVVIAFGQLLKEPVLELPRVACVNVHASLLPKYRGASPINSAILAGDKKTGIAFMQMAQGLDSGPVYKVQEIDIDESDNAGSLQDKLAELSALNIVTVLREIAAGQLKPVEQESGLATYCHKINKKDALIDWEMDALSIKNRIHAYYPWPVAHFFLVSSTGTKRISIISAVVSEETTIEKPGTVLYGGKNSWLIACGANTVLEILTVKPEGKKLMTGSDFLRGSQLNAGVSLNNQLLTK